MKRSGLLCLGVLGFLILMVHGSQVVPVAISPGSERGVAFVGQLCPTFSWTAVDWATGYRVAVFQAFGVQIPSYEEMAAGGVPVLSKEIQGRASSWTPSSEEQLSSGSLYVWYVQAADSSGQGTWSKGKLFMVEVGVMASLAEERVKKTLREKGVREDVITDVLKEMKTEGPGVIAGRADSKPQSKVGTQGYEGDTNTFYGLGAGFSITTGLYNTFIGRSAGYSNATASYNTFIGYNAGYNNTTGYGSTFLGNGAGRYNTTGIENTFLGHYAGVLNSTGYSNTFVGYCVGYDNTTGYANTFLGHGAGRYNTTGAYNTFLGHETGRANTTGAYNTFIGYRAGYSNTTANFNTFLGIYTGYSNTTGTYNTFLGYRAGYSNTTANFNTFLGYNAGYNNTTGTYNTFLGYGTGVSNTTANNNTFVGYYAGFSNITGNANTFLGLEAGYSNTTGFYNTFLGHYAGHSNTTGYENTFLGHYAGYYNTAGFSNTFLGYYAGFSNTTGAYNAFLGHQAGFSNTGTANIFLGYRAGYNETGSNKLYVANSDTSAPLIYGEFNNSILAVNGKFGVGTQTPTYPMELKTTGRNATFVLQRSDGGAINFVNATPAYGQFGTGNNYPVRILVNSTWRMSLNTDNSLAMINGATCTAGGVWTNASSRELKENIEGLTVDEAQEALAELSPVKYNYKADKAERHVGFIAEDVPALVASKDRKSLSPMDVVAVLTRVVQEQQKTILDYQKTISELKERVGKLEKKGKQ